MPAQRNIGPTIKELYASGLSYNEIVEKLGCAKSTVAFHINDTTWRKSYQRKAQRHRDNVEFLKRERGGKCEICGFDLSMRALHFHHRIPAEKKFALSEKKGMALENMKVEAEKCALVCGNCHTMIHQNLLECPPAKK
jgi:hypothetical protein